MSAALEAAICTVALADGFIPGQAHLQNVEPELAALNLPRATVAAPHLRTILSNSSGFGGSNVALVLRRWETA